VGSNFPLTKSITFDYKKGGMELIVKYSPQADLLPGMPSDIAHYVINEAEPKHDIFCFILRVSNNINQIPILESSELKEECEEEELNLNNKD
jgi:hypothetical protein